MTDCTMTSMTPSLPVKFAGKQILCDISIIHLLLHMYWIHLYTWDIHMPCIHVYTWDDVSCIIPCSTSGAMSRLAHRLPSGSWAPHITPICSSNLILSLILDPCSLSCTLNQGVLWEISRTHITPICSSKLILSLILDPKKSLEWGGYLILPWANTNFKC